MESKADNDSRRSREVQWSDALGAAWRQTLASLTTPAESRDHVGGVPHWCPQDVHPFWRHTARPRRTRYVRRPRRTSRTQRARHKRASLI